MTSRRGRDPRERIIDAAWAAVDEAGPEQLLGGVSLRDVARRLGVSPSTVTYHFSGPAELGRAMAEALFAMEFQLPVDRVAEALAADLPFGEAVRAAVRANWDELTAGWSQVYERRLMRLFAASGDHPGGLEATRRMKDFYFAAVEDANSTLFDEVIARHGRRWVEPFTSAEVARIASALLEQLLQQWMVDRDAIRPDLAADAVVAVVGGLTVDLRHHRGVEELQASLDAAAGADPVDGDGAGELADPRVAREAAAAAASLFVHGVAGVTLTDVARASGRPVTELAARFRTPGRVAAVAFARHLEEVAAAGDRRRDEDPVLGLVDLLCELVRRARKDPGCARALLCERIQACSAEDLRTLVPLDELVLRAVRAAAPHVAEPALVSALVADHTLDHAVRSTATAPAAVATAALRLLGEPVG